MTKKFNNVLKRLEQSSCSEAYAVAECLRGIAENGEESAEDEFLIECAKEVRSWADYVVTMMEGNNGLQAQHPTNRTPAE